MDVYIFIQILIQLIQTIGFLVINRLIMIHQEQI